MSAKILKYCCPITVSVFNSLNISHVLEFNVFSGADMCKDCSLLVTSTKFGTEIDFDILIKI